MTIEHKNIPDADLHEPKGVATALERTIYTADGLGSGVWGHTSTSCHGAMEIVNNSTATSVTAAVDATLNTDSDYVKITAGWTGPHLHNMSFNIDEMIADIAGHYELFFWASIKIPSINNFIGLKFAINDTTPFSAQKIVSQSATAGDYRNISGSAAVDLSATDTISIYIAASKTDNIIIEEAGLNMVLLHEA